MIEFQDVRFGYRGAGVGFSLRIDTLSIGPGTRAACIGPSGSGKTTLVNLMAGIISPESGRIRVLGEQLETMNAESRRRLRLTRIGMVFQEFELLEYLSAWENICLSVWLDDTCNQPRLKARAKELAEAAGITHCLDRKPRELSQGERQRVGICRALANSPGLILCDEPTGNLDPTTTRGVLNLLIEQAQATNAAMVMVTHNHGLLDHFQQVIDMSQLGVRG